MTDDRRQDRVVDGDQLGRVLRLVRRLGDDHRDGIADVAHAIGREARPAGVGVVGAVPVLDRRHAHRKAELGGGDIGAGIDGENARRLARRGGVDPLDRGMGVRRAQEGGVDLARAGEVIDVMAGTGDEPDILLAADRLADSELSHSQVSRCDDGDVMVTQNKGVAAIVML